MTSSPRSCTDGLKDYMRYQKKWNRKKWSPESKVIGCAKTPEAGIKEHLSFLRSLKEDLRKPGTVLRKRDRIKKNVEQ